MNKIPIICFHGSPGVPEEFDKLNKLLPNYQFIKFVREGYPKNEYIFKIDNFSEDTTLNKEAIVVGYSWGNVPALQFAIKNLAFIKGLVIISPYIFPDRNSSSTFRKLLTLPLIGTFFFGMFGKKVVEKMMKNTSYPESIPSDYKKLVNKLSKSKVLETSIKEKTENIKIKEILKRIGESHIPVALIWGGRDVTGRESEQIASIKSIIKPILEVRLENAGHALIFTRAEELSKYIESFINKIDKGEKK